MNELRCGVDEGMPIVFLLETDISHGGVPLETHVREARASKECDDRLVEVLLQHRDSGQIVPWYRVRPLQDVSLRLILQVILEKDRRQLSEMFRHDKVYISSEVLRQPVKLRPPQHGGKRFHVYVSENNPAACELVAQLAAELQGAPSSSGRYQRSAQPELCYTTSRSEADAALHFLLVLNRETWSDKANPRRKELEEEVRDVIRARRQLAV